MLKKEALFLEATKNSGQPFHLVDFSSWPAFASLGAFCATLGGVRALQGYFDGVRLCRIGVSIIILGSAFWWRDVTREARYQGLHRRRVTQGMRWGMILFIISEIFFFVAFFWAYFHSSLAPTIELGGVWPPKGLNVLDAWGVPWLNTVVLVSSGVRLTWAHYGVLSGYHYSIKIGLMITLVLAVAFTILQVGEYYETSFSLADGIYGSTFFLATGFHGFHVLIGTSFLYVCLGRFLLNHFRADHHFGFEGAVWYWHFVDVVWLFLFGALYWWGS